MYTVVPTPGAVQRASFKIPPDLAWQTSTQCLKANNHEQIFLLICFLQKKGCVAAISNNCASFF
jgi:hypothetical protein